MPTTDTYLNRTFYLDSPSNAKKAGMTVKVSDDIQEAANEEFSTIHKLILENFGKVTSDIDDPKLTHIVIFKKDRGRRIELMRRTEKWVLFCFHITVPRH